MIAEKALRLAGAISSTQVHLVARRGGRLHVYAGPLTPSGRFVPRSARTVCRTRTRRLEVVAVEASTLVLEESANRRVCGRCSARLTGISRAEQHPTTRADHLAAYADLTKADVAVALQLADTPAEVDAAAHLSLVLFDVVGTMTGFTERGRDWRPLHKLVHEARARVRGFPDSYYIAHERGAAHTAAGRELAKARSREARAEREARIALLGISNVSSRQPRRPTNRGARP